MARPVRQKERGRGSRMQVAYRRQAGQEVCKGRRGAREDLLWSVAPLPRAPVYLTPVTPGQLGRARGLSHLGESGIGIASSQLGTPRNQDSCGRLPSSSFSPEICAQNTCLFAKHLFPENSLILSHFFFVSNILCFHKSHIPSVLFCSTLAEPDLFFKKHLAL